MKSTLLVKTSADIPLAVQEWAKAEQFSLHFCAPDEDNWQDLLNQVSHILLLQPERRLDTYVTSQQLWWQYLYNHRPDAHFIVMGFTHLNHPCYLDLFRWKEALQRDWPTLNAIESLPDLPGSNLSLKLKRFFDGHGDDSLVAVLTRLRRTLVMAGRELREMGTSFDEVYHDLIAPRQLDSKWQAWRNRWTNYHSWFQGTPITNELNRIAVLSDTIEPWMLAGGRDELPIQDDSVLNHLNSIRAQLQHIEKLYVNQKLPHTHR